MSLCPRETLMSFKHLVVLCCALVAVAPHCWAADVTPEQATALEGEIRTWLSGLVGPSAKVSERPAQVSPEGDHFAVVVPIGPASGGFQLTATARPLASGTWDIDNIRIPNTAEFTVDLPMPKDGDASTAVTGPVTYKLRVGGQSGQMRFDSSYLTPSTFTSSLKDLDLQASGPQLEQTTHVDRSATTSILRPVRDGRVDVLSDGTLEGYRIDAKMGDNQRIGLAMQRVRVVAEANGVSRERATQIGQALGQINALTQAQTKAGAGAAEAKLDAAVLQGLLEAVADLASGVSIEETADKVSFSFGDTSGTLNAMRLGMAGKAEQGILQARMDIGMEGLALPDLPLGEMAALIPRTISLRPVFSGVSMADLTRWAKDSENGQKAPSADVAALFSHGGINAGLESFSIDVAGASFTGMGKLTFTSPEAFSGTAQITATNLDVLQQRVAAMPELAGAVPVFIMAKGIGRTVENRVVWDVTYRDGRLLVNNQDLSAMAGSSGAAPGVSSPGGSGPGGAPKTQKPPRK
ncbi:MAG: hypothetical protein NVSMB18_25780 [Acetobacteraceae bacterium]